MVDLLSGGPRLYSCKQLYIHKYAHSKGAPLSYSRFETKKIHNPRSGWAPLTSTCNNWKEAGHIFQSK